jgi:hypothetical protein
MMIIKVKDLCAAYIKQSWERCRILEIKNNMAKVEAVDNGDIQDIKLNKLQNLRDEFKILPRLAFKARLVGTHKGIFDLTKVGKFIQMISSRPILFKAQILEYKA